MNQCQAIFDWVDTINHPAIAGDLISDLSLDSLLWK